MRSEAPGSPAQGQVTDLACRAQRLHAARCARQPRVEHDALTDFEPFGLGPERHDVGDDLVPEDVED